MDEKDLNYELIALRISLARIAQAVGVEHPGLPVRGKGYSGLYLMARDNSTGWNTLASMVKDAVEELRGLDNPGHMTMQQLQEKAV